MNILEKTCRELDCRFGDVVSIDRNKNSLLYHGCLKILKDEEIENDI